LRQPIVGCAGLRLVMIDTRMTSLNRKPVAPERRLDAAARALSCAFCRHPNPSDARYCNHCGAPLAAVPCPRCGTISDAGAHACKICGADLGDGSGDALFQPLPPAFKPGSPLQVANREPPEAPEAVPSWDTPMFILDPPGQGGPAATPATPARGDVAAQPDAASGLPKRVIGAMAILAVVTVIGVLVSRQSPRDESPSPHTASGAVTVSPAASAPASTPAAVPATETASPGTAVTRMAAPPAAAAPRTRTEPAPPPPRRAIEAPPVSAPPAARIGPCTEAVAALGLCTLPATPAKEP